jgi:F-type H+-transporting ATPase subunit delta
MSAYTRSYARAIVEAAPKGYDFAAFLEGTSTVARALTTDRRLREFFTAPSIAKPPKERALEALGQKVGLDAFGLRFLRVVLQHGRLTHLTEILAAAREELDRSGGVVPAHVTVAAAIGPEEQKRLAEALGRSLGGSIRLDVAVDEGILGGFVARVRSRIIDASVASAIERFKERSKETAGA